MSWVANLLLSVDMEEDPALVESFDQWLRNEASAKGVGSIRPLHQNPDAWGGFKHPEAKIWAGVLNHANIPAVVDRFATTAWRLPQFAQLFIQDENQGAFRLWMIRDGKPHQYAPLPDHGEDDFPEPPDDGSAR